MKVYDPLYGAFEVPANLTELLTTPEVRRLSQVRLLNTLSPSLATLGELRRYSHTLGVLFLAGLNMASGYSSEEHHALAAAVLLHDIGTPPFGHLMEYHLRDRTGWNHEQIITLILSGNHAPENRAHQIFGGRSIEFLATLRNSPISVELVESIIASRHPLSSLLFGSIDLDNLDNVARMTWALGLGHDGANVAMGIASALRIGRDGALLLDQARHREFIQTWTSLRARAYNVLAFDVPTVAAQAVLSDAIGQAICQEVIGEEDWSLSDEDLLQKLRSNPGTKKAIVREYLGRLPSMAFCVQVNGSLADCGVSDREAGKRLIEEVLGSHFRGGHPLGYIFIDRGAFEKELTFKNLDGRGEWRIGRTSRTVIFYGFVRGLSRLPINRCTAAANDFVTKIGIAQTGIRRVIVGEREQFHASSSFGF